MSHASFEEESIPGYEAKEFYPIHIGNNIGTRYVVLGKLGYGANSTVWLCRDLRTSGHVAVKVCTRTPSDSIQRERRMYEHLATKRTSPGRGNIQEALDTFQLTRNDGSTHLCIVQEPLHVSLFSFQKMYGASKPLPETLVKPIVRYMLQALHFLHVDAQVTHCDLKRANIMLKIEDKTVLDDFEKAERESPSFQKHINTERSVYASRRFRPPKDFAFGPPTICDFGEARIGVSHQFEEIQPEIYKAPEILMQFEWTNTADIWNLACLVWDLVEKTHLFDGYDDEDFHNNRVHMWEMVCLLGEPPLEFVRRSPHAWRLFDDEGHWKALPAVSRCSLQDRVQCLSGESKAQFIDFLLSMLRWLPEERWAAGALLNHPWLAEG